MLVFVEEGKQENPDKNPQSRARINNELNPRMTPHRNRIQTTVVGGERSHHCLLTEKKVFIVRDVRKFVLDNWSNLTRLIQYHWMMELEHGLLRSQRFFACNEGGKLNERVEVASSLNLQSSFPYLTLFYLFSQGNVIFSRDESGDFEKWFLWQPWVLFIQVIVILRSNCLVLSFQDFQQDLQIQLAEYNFIFSLGTTIKMKASEDCKARIEDQLNSISSLKKSLFDEIDSHLQNLNSKSKQWEGFKEQMDEFVEYMDKVDSRLERSRRESRVSQEWLAQVKVR